ncbi:MAG TPA: hypothetical protein VF735_17040 [Pyrinomonadaceae bacterium]|jgi:hypothetical protein
MNRFTQLIALSLILTIFCLPTPKTILAQDAPAPTTSDVTIPDGTELTVVLQDEISSGTATEGDAVNFRTKDDVKINGKVVIAKDTLVKGTIANAQKAGRMGKGGKLGIRIESTTTVDGEKIRLRASKGNEGGDKVGTVIALSVFFGLFGLLKRGKNAKIKAGTEIKAYTDEAKTVKIAA